MVEYKVRWKGGKESWIPRSLILEVDLFSESSLKVLHDFEVFDEAKRAHESRTIVEKAATRIQTAIRGFIMRVVWHRKLKSALLIQTKFRANQLVGAKETE